MHSLAAAMSPAPAVTDNSEAADTARKIDDARREILGEYRQRHRYPWVVAYSGGKDSTLVLQLVFEMLLALPPEERRREVHVVGNDTLVESPPVIEHLHASIKKIREAARKFNLPLSAAVTKPDIDQTFWVNVIGRGYAPPSRIFRWCTDRMKIQPTNGYILRRVHERGSVILLIGARRAESANRRRTMDKYHRRGRLSKHPSLAKCRIFSPISELETDEVWMTLLQRPSPWGGTHRDLVTLHRNARDEECGVSEIMKEESGRNALGGFGIWLNKIGNACKPATQDPLCEKIPGEVAGIMPVAVCRKIFRKLREVEAQMNRGFISEDEVLTIQDIWREREVVEKIRARSY